jgi:hypothetical protein
MLRVSYSQQEVLNNNQLKAAAENAATMAAAEATVVAVKNLMLVVATMTAVKTASEEQISDHVQYIVLFDRLFSCFVPINI